MNRCHTLVLTCLLFTGFSLNLLAQESTYVDFGTGEFLSSNRGGSDSSIGLVKNLPHNDKQLEPMAVGNFWVYESKSISNANEVTKHVVRITSKERHSDGEWFVYKIGDEEDAAYYQRIDGESIKLKFDDKVVECLRLRPTQGESYGTIDDKLTITSTERIVKTNVGEFKCIELTHEYRVEVEQVPGGTIDLEQSVSEVLSNEIKASRPKRWAKSIFWYHPGIGIVGIESEDSLDLLIGFNVSN